MQTKSQLYEIIGMNQDDSYSSFDKKFSWENKNIRVTAIDDNNLLSISNEKGNGKLFINVLNYGNQKQYI